MPNHTTSDIQLPVKEIIDRLEFFDAFSSSEKQTIAEDETHFQVYRTKEVLIREGDMDTTLFIVLYGSVSVGKKDRDTVYTVLKPGEILGEIAFLTDTKRTADVVALEKTIVLKLEKLVFERFNSQIREKIKDKIIKKLVTRLESMNRMLVKKEDRIGQSVGMPKSEAPGNLRRQISERYDFGRPLIKKIVKNIKSLPPMPKVMVKAAEIMARPDSNPIELADLIQNDMALVAGVLKVANSAYYGFKGKVSSIHHAASLFGSKRLAEIIASISATGLLGKAFKGYGLKDGDMWMHSMATAHASKLIAEKIQSEHVDDAYMAGLLHDAGKILLDPYVNERKAYFDKALEKDNRTIQDVEKELLGFDHGEITSAVCDKWNLPPLISSAIKFHHKPSASGGDELAYIIHLADAVTSMAGIGTGSFVLAYRLDETAEIFLGIKVTDLSAIKDQVIAHVQEIAEYVGH